MKSQPIAKKKSPRNPREMPATQGMLYEVRGELIEKMSKFQVELKAEMHGIKSELKAEMHGIKSELKAEMHGIKSDIHRMAALMEEQNAKNNVVLDALMGIS